MEIREIGRMISDLRTSRNIPQKNLCKGICSVATLSRLEAGERRPDILVFNALCQRLGTSSDNIEVALTQEEFEYFVRRRNVEIFLSLQEYHKAKCELAVIEMEEKGQNPLRKQDIYRLYTVISLLWKKEYVEAEEYLFKAIVETIPDFGEMILKCHETFIMKLWLSEVETELLLLYAYVREEIEKDGMELLKSIRNYIYLKVTDEEAKNKRIAQTMYLMARINKKNKKWKECYGDCEEVITAEVKNGTMLLVYQVLTIEMLCLDQGIFVEGCQFRRKQYEVLREIWKEYGGCIAEEIPVCFMQQISQEKYLIDELIYYARLKNEISQEELSDGICAPETLSRIETGKRNPTVKNFHALINKLGVGVGYYNTYFDAKKFETLEKGKKLQKCIMFGKFEEAEIWLREIEEEIDKSTIRNRQYLEFYGIVIDWRLRRISAETALNRTKVILELTFQKKQEQFQLRCQTTQIEISLLNELAVIYRNIGKQKQAVEILMSIYEYFHNGRMRPTEQGKKYFMVLSNLASYMEEINELEKSIEFADECIAEVLKCGKGMALGRNLLSKAYAQERMQKKSCLSLYEQGYYMCELFEDTRNQSIVKEHVRDKWGIDIDKV